MSDRGPSGPSPQATRAGTEGAMSDRGSSPEATGARHDAAGVLELAGRLGVELNDIAHLEMALAHRSWCGEHPGFESNERLEFLGDAVLDFAVTTHLFQEFAGFPEGQLTEVRSAVVSSAALVEVAQAIGLGRHLLLGKGEDRSGGREKPSILEDAFEAVIGAVYVDGGWEAAYPMIMRLLGDRIVLAAAGSTGREYKGLLQEHAARAFRQLPRYDVTSEGPVHDKHFSAAVSIEDKVWGQGEGNTKKQAEQAAAEAAWLALNELSQDDKGGTPEDARPVQDG